MDNVLSHLKRFYIGGRWVTPRSNNVMAVINPADESVSGELAIADIEDVEDAIQAAKAAFEDYANTSKEERLRWLSNLLEISKDRLDEMGKVISLEIGAPISMAVNAQANAGVCHLEDFINVYRNQSARETMANGDVICREPVGVCGLITPWNWPVSQIAKKVIPALATGCTCVLKPSEYAALSPLLYAEMIHEAGFPSGAFNLIQGVGPVAGAALSKSPVVDMISFTGSTRAGIQVSKDAADTVKRVALELGGKSPNIVFADSDLKNRVESSIHDCFYNSGQSCNAPTRMLVERSCLDEVLNLAAGIGSKYPVGNPMEPGGHIGPVVSDVQFQRVRGLIEAGIKEGDEPICGGVGKPDGIEKGYYVRPTVFLCQSNDTTIARQEVFGPVLSIIPFDTEEEAVNMANNSDYGLAAYIQTEDKDKAARVAARLRAGGVYVNGDCQRYGSPFGGYKQSGNGREGGLMGIEEFQEVKTLVMN